jgi:acetylornithine deacetylase/succinyl-diaminopimelate desuccinylase-like protein
MENTKPIIAELADLPNYRNSFTEPLAQMGVTTIDDIQHVLMDEERTALMIASVKGLGSRTVQGWRAVLAASGAEEPVGSGSERAVTGTDTEGKAAEEVELSPVAVKVAPAKIEVERDLSCSMTDLSEIQRTAVDLLKMNGAKKKGLLASVAYATKRLIAAGMNVTVAQESGAPAIVARMGEGGILLWGHLDTDRLDDMKRKEQGVVQGDMVHGRGAANTKGAVASLICAAERAATWRVPFSVVLTTDALDEQKGAQELAESPVVQNSRGILIFGPTGMRPVIGQAGYAAIRVRISGEGAIMKMAAFLDMLSGQAQGSSGRLAIKLGMIRGGKRGRPFDPARSCEVAIELETLDATDSAIQMINELLTGAESQIEDLCRSEMVEFDRSSDLAKMMTELTKKEPTLMMVHSEATEIVAVNQKIIVWGPGTVANALSDQEFVTLRELEGTYEAVLSLIDGSAPLQS